MLLGAIFEVASAAYELSTVVTDVILNYEYINRHWLEEYILSIVFLVVNGIVMGFVGLGIDAMYPSRFSYNKPINKALGFCIGLLQMRVFVETLYAVVAGVKCERGDKPAPEDAQPATDAGSSRTHTVGGHTVAEATTEDASRLVKQLGSGLLYATFIQVIVRDIPLFVLQANATIHYRKWKFLDLFTVLSTFLTLTRGTAVYVAKEDGGGMKCLAFVFLVGQFVFRLGGILLLAMTKGLAILVYGLVITLFAILWTAKLRLAHPSHRFVDQLPRAIVFFPFFTLFVVDGSKLTARHGSAVTALYSKKLVHLHLWRCLENVVAVLLAVFLPRYTDFGVSSDAAVALIGVVCAAIYVAAAAAYSFASDCCAKRGPNGADVNNGAAVPVERPYYIA
ncbi:hypothetical protein PHYPSEUDO_007052 [Phytophthora pseudosyringae]|uniref:Uncharacterized protein n=1 Tax=Phytophthora pseudosyringae TaxID=221518 RepID=A0A8T1VH26_9STRA|nr:hypothetical protein PHYPSEUDO_007052 [Phytophthora pseudosyringae]